MTTLAAAFYVPHPLPTRGGSPGSSPESNAISAEFERMRQHARAAASTMQSQARVLLGEIAVECAHPNWDGYAAKPIKRSTIARTLAFLDCLPAAMPSPDIIPQADGELAIEWYISPRQLFAVSIGECGPVHYAGLFDKDGESHGVARFEASISEEIFFYLDKLFRQPTGAG